MRKYLWKITQDKVRDYDTFDSAVVCAVSEAEAKKIHPILSWGRAQASDWGSTSWVTSPDDVEAEKIGVATRSVKVGTVICASFNAG